MRAQSYIYELRITLQEIRPPIWRLIQVPSTYPLCCLHDVLQAVMGWTDSHLHQFERDGQYWGVPEDYEEADIDIIDERRTKISAILKAQGDSMLYVYDLGDEWRHELVLERIFPYRIRRCARSAFPANATARQRTWGSPPGYEQFLEVIFEPRHEEYEHSVRWAGGPSALTQSAERFQPEEFDARAVNAILSQRRWPPRHRP